MWRLRLKCDGTRAETRFRLSAKVTSPFKAAGASVQSTTGSRGVRISRSNAGYTMFRVSEGYWLPTPFASFLFTSPPVRHSVPSRFNWTQPHNVNRRCNYCSCTHIFGYAIKTRLWDNKNDFVWKLLSWVGIATRYRLDGPGIESRLEARFSVPVQIGPGDHIASYMSTIGTWSFPGVKRPRSGVDRPSSI